MLIAINGCCQSKKIQAPHLSQTDIFHHLDEKRWGMYSSADVGCFHRQNEERAPASFGDSISKNKSRSVEEIRGKLCTELLGRWSVNTLL